MTTQITWDKEADVVIVGYGGAGAAAAIEAHDAGAKVLVVEKMPEGGGNTAISAGIVYGAGTSVQKSKGIEDSAEGAFKYMKAAAEGLADEDRVKLMADKGGEVIEWLMKLGAKFNADFMYMSGFEYFPQYEKITPPVARGHPVQEGTGAGLWGPLSKAVNERGIEILFNTPVKELIADPVTKEVRGVKTDKGNFKAKKAVILTTGGFVRNEEMFKNYLTAYTGVYPGSAVGLAGDGIKMGQALGAELRNMGLLEPLVPGVPFGPPSYEHFIVNAVPMITVVYLAPCIVVDKKGKRFINEYSHYDFYGIKLTLELEGQVAFCIFDENTRKMGALAILAPPQSDDLSKEIEMGAVKTAPTLKELAGKIGIAPDTLEDTVYTFNENAEKGVDPEFGRTMHLVPIKTPPYYAMEYKPTCFLTAGGLKTNTNSQVIDVTGRVIPRLYAAGETTGGYFGRWYASGYCLCNAFVSGRVAGKKAAAEAP